MSEPDPTTDRRIAELKTEQAEARAQLAARTAATTTQKAAIAAAATASEGRLMQARQGRGTP